MPKPYPKEFRDDVVDGIRPGITVIHLNTGELLSEHNIDPSRNYWRNQLKEPGRWPGSKT
ncbi:MAG TPA: hypothetical protein PLQ19_04500 [Aeromicrobium sp.]|nr:hypothetical protein [Aeromicrobium sp.]